MKKRGHDFASTALRVVEQAIGEHMDGTPLEKPKTTSRAVGGKKGGQARAISLTAEERVEIARRAAKKRWSSSKKSGRG